MHPSRRSFLKATSIAGTVGVPPGKSERDHWIDMLVRVADPVLVALSERKLKATMPVEAPHGNVADRRQYTYLEALGRLLAGQSAWLESGANSGKEGDLRLRYADLARRSIAAAVDPSSADFMNFDRGSQPVVDAAFLALAMLRAPHQLWEKLDGKTRSQVIQALRSSRVIRPGFNNWLLFSATIEAFFCQVGEPWDAMRVDYAIRQHEEWYKDDGVYGDGPFFHWDYYNSFVIQPMLLAVIESVSRASDAWKSFYPAIVNRAVRYAAIEERLIGPDGTYPPIGRSLAYRCGAFHHLANMALRRQLPEGVSPEQVRGALNAVIQRTLGVTDTFDGRGWLTVGLCGHQPSIAEPYISTGSLYLCSVAFLPLGLSAGDPFWSNPMQPWTQKKAWSGEDVAADHAIQS